ncbi:MAG: Holliday junction resolvase RuvX [candidate division KSB1 bacterium]|nr:Holliday junction resolvase RuvX [candidate division KSB1 bacterium]MDZ7365731.1 Holliday junction resolvase RuvX [candidate division KSB1 bacterium]MDZ7403789.1 Holliday junction resolvase RuvX [candidate division KSB1 bacterium]
MPFDALDTPRQESNMTPPAGLAGRILAVDFGLKRAGLAISDPMQIIATGLETLQYKSRRALVQRLVAIIRENEVVRLVIGLPRHMDGSEGEMAKQARDLMREIEARVSIPIVAWDERLSSVQAERALREMGISSRTTRRGGVDRMAAVFILQSYLDSLKRMHLKTN